MSTRATLPTPRRLVRWVRERVARQDDEGGFVLMETMVALTLITVIMAAVGVEYVNGIVVSAHQRSSVSAAQIASSSMSELRSLDPSDLLNGRTLNAVTAQRDRLASIDKVKPWVSTGATKLAWNNAPAPAGTPVPATAVSTPASGETFRVDKYLECQDDTTQTTNADGTKQQSCGSSAATNTVRAVVVVGWDDRGCPTAGCAFVSSTLIDSHANPTFDLNQKLPAAPVVQAPGDQSVVVDDAVSLQLLVQDGKGAAPFTWALTAGSLPNGLSISPAGLISGNVAGSPTSNTSTVTVTDAFLRKADATIKWTVGPRLAFTAVGDQKSLVRQSVNLTLAATGGSGAGYTYTDPGNTLPAGLTLSSAGRITGAATTVGTKLVTLTVTDSGKRTATTSFTWNVEYPPIAITNPGTQVATKDRPETIQVTASGGSESFTYAATGLPAGLSINASTGRITGTPTATGSSSVTVTATDTATRATQPTTFTLSVVAAPTVTAPANQTSTKGAGVDLAIGSSCPNGPCTYTATGLPAGLNVDSSTGRITGTVSAIAGSFPVRVTATDAAGGTGSATFTWTVNNAPTFATPGTQTSRNNTFVTVPFAGFVSGGTGGYTYSAVNLPSNLSINASTGVVTGTTVNAIRSYPNVQITATDSQGVSATSGTFTWVVTNLSLTIADQTNRRNVADTFTFRATGGDSPYSYSVSGLPAGLVYTAASTTTGRISGIPTAPAATYPVTVTVTDDDGASVTVTFRYVVTT